MPAPGLTRDDSEAIGFVIACLFAGAITRPELHRWCDEQIRAHDVADLPDYLFDLASFEGSLVELHKLLGFNPSWQHQEADARSLTGIAVRRGLDPGDLPVSPVGAEKLLKRRPYLEQRFRETFPFIEW